MHVKGTGGVVQAYSWRKKKNKNMSRSYDHNKTLAERHTNLKKYAIGNF